MGYEVYLTDTSKGTEVYEAIMKAGAPYGLRPTGPSDIRRIEGAIFNWGADMTYENNAFELGLERLVDFDLADSASISMAAYRRIRRDGVANKINGVVFGGEPFPELNNTKWPCLGCRPRGRQGDIGDLLAAARGQHRIRLAADRAFRARSVVEVETEWGGRDATVTPMPFVDPQKKIPLS